MATKKDGVGIDLPKLQIASFTLKLVGDTPLICHAWSHKAKQMILQKEQKKAKVGKEIRRPYVDFAESLYWVPAESKPNFDGLSDEEVAKLLAEVIPQSQFGFPTIAFKSAALNAGFQQGALVSKAGTGDLAKTTARGSIRVIGEFAIIEGLPTIREDMVRIGKGADLCYRAEFKSWRTSLQVQFNTHSTSAEQIINLFNIGGFANGIGDWRPEKNGTFGTYHVEVG